MKKAMIRCLLAAMASMVLTGCTDCRVCHGAGLQTVYRTYQLKPGGPYYQDVATVVCSGCGGAGWNGGSFVNFIWAACGGNFMAHGHWGVAPGYPVGPAPHGNPAHGGAPHGNPSPGAPAHGAPHHR